MRSDDDMKNYWRQYSKFGQHEQVTKNLTLNQNNQKEIITVKTSLIDQQFSRSDYKLHKTSYLSSNTKISDVTMMWKRGTGNGKQGTGKGKHETGTRKQETGSESRGKEKWKMGTKTEKGNENTDRAAVPTSFPGFSSIRPYGLSTKRRENLGTRLLGFKLGFVPVFHFPVPVLVTCLKNPTSIILFIRKRATGSRQLFLRYITCFHPFFGTTEMRNAWNYILCMRSIQRGS